ncbi:MULTISPECIES: hypothetical protein [unclassified Acinetobacter]|uniref:hypothetical protein n=1 Tax=unclassified Acinetobacter TaxID=196816 RepID=UPI00257860B0|nr:MULTISPECIES: hypothetical protein [unclassified Acinetobacter]
MKKVTSVLLATFTSIVFASSAMAATPTHHVSHQAKTHHVSTQQPSVDKHTGLLKTESDAKINTKTATLK